MEGPGRRLRKTEIAEALTQTGLVASIQASGEQRLCRVVAALTNGGIQAVELAYATLQSAGRLIPKLKENGVLVGVGALTRSSQARESCMFGADFVTAAVISPDVVAACEEMDIPCILSALTPTEFWRAHEMKADFVKIVSVEALGGTQYVHSLRETLPAQRLMVGEIPLDSYLPYLEAGVEVFEFKSSLALPELVEREEWAEISRRASKIVNTRANWRASRKQHT